ncbi:MAG: hypothetical protein KKA48_10400, partial [Proteobacteria bacterium]|nr:hypothetical protein [Pseudomonadota bacterium]
PMEVDTFNGGTQSGFVDSIAAANKAVIDSFFNLKLQKTVYVNSGTWVDADPYPYPTMTFAVIIPQKTNGSTTEYIATYQYFHGGDIQRLAHDVITNLN